MAPDLDRPYDPDMERLPSFVRELFWEGLAEDLGPERHADYIAIRVLETGGEPGRPVASRALRP